MATGLLGPAPRISVSREAGVGLENLHTHKSPDAAVAYFENHWF